MNELSPRDVLNRTFHAWPFVVLGVLLGGLLGWLFSYIRPPIYEAHADILIKVNYELWAQENDVDMIQEILISNSSQPISEIIFSDRVIEDLVTAAQAEGIPIDRHTILTTFTIQRVNLDWQMTVRHADPAIAAYLADLWVKVAIPAYQEAHDHAALSYAMEVERITLGKCFKETDFAAGNVCAGTSYTSPADLEIKLMDLNARITTERESAHGVDVALTLESGAPASIPYTPVRYGRSWLAIAGTLIGLIVGITVAQGLIPLRKKEHARAS